MITAMTRTAMEEVPVQSQNTSGKSPKQNLWLKLYINAQHIHWVEPHEIANILLLWQLHMVQRGNLKILPQDNKYQLKDIIETW